MSENSKKRIIFEWLLALVTIFLTISFIVIAAHFVFEKIYSHKIYPNIYLGQINLGGRTPEQARLILNEKIDSLHQTGINFYFDNQYTTVLPTVSSAETDLIYDIISFNVDETINLALSFGRNNSFINNFYNKLRLLIYGQPGFPLKMQFGINEDQIKTMLADNFSEYEIPAQNASLAYSYNKFSITEERSGTIIDYTKGINKLKKNLQTLDDSAITLNAKTDYPQITMSDCEKLKNEAEETLALSPLSLEYENNEWEISRDQLGEWLSAKINTTANRQQAVVLGLNSLKVNKFFTQTIIPDINLEPLDAKFNMENGRVVEFQASRDGIKLDETATILKLEKTLNQGSSTIKLITKTLKSQVKTQEVNSLGIKEVIGIGHSNFIGSPVNRRHNIRNGANTLHGLLIKPDEEFSLNNALGEIDKASGYLPELVIKGNKTIPEYGGGLCQIGTTMFRVAIGTGLPITMRRNHSYRVSYYEPAGTDATIYSPWPDLKFINDTGNHILIQSRIDGNDLYFDFWGSSDGRIASQTDPVIYNITRPGPTKYIETLDLPVGEKKCTEHAHNGADTYFDYMVIYPDGEVLEKRFKSHYIPWREVCLIGVEELSAETEEETATSTQSQTN